MDRIKMDKKDFYSNYDSLYLRIISDKGFGIVGRDSVGRRDLNPRPQGYEPCELPDYSTPRSEDVELKRNKKK